MGQVNTLSLPWKQKYLLSQSSSSKWQLQPRLAALQLCRVRQVALHPPVSEKWLRFSQMSLHALDVSCRDCPQLRWQICYVLDVNGHLRNVYFWEPEDGVKYAGSIAERRLLNRIPLAHPMSSIQKPAKGARIKPTSALIYAFATSSAMIVKVLHKTVAQGQRIGTWR